MFTRGSASAKRFATLDDYLANTDPTAEATVRTILSTISNAYPETVLVITWNQPMVQAGDDYVFGISIQRHHILIAPWGKTVLPAFASRLSGLKVNKKTLQIPLDWPIDEQLVRDMVGARLAEVAQHDTR